MAKFKKKKSSPTPGPEPKPIKEPPVEEGKIPETESVESKPSSPPPEPQTNDAEKSDKEKKLNLLFWLRVGFAVAAGAMATFLFDGMADMEEKRWTSIGFMIIVFIVTVIIAKGMKMQLPSSDRKKIVTQGIGSYIFIYLFIWVLTNTLLHGSTAVTGIPSPIP